MPRRNTCRAISPPAQSSRPLRRAEQQRGEKGHHSRRLLPGRGGGAGLRGGRPAWGRGLTLIDGCHPCRRAADQVAVLVGVPVNERLYEGALRDDGLAGGTDVVERLSHQLAPEALTPVVGRGL